MRLSPLLLIILIVGCGELENPTDEKNPVVAAQKTSNEDFKPVFEKKDKINVEIKPDFKIAESEEPVNEDPEITIDIIKRSEEYSGTQELGPEYKEVGHYGPNSCQGLIYKKEFEVSFHYVFEDCKGNRINQIVRK